ncbi:MAG: ADP-forming succinate--CoA ligase subunit beta [Omnitrophica bacterium]|nr:ADP-forming succinate--CoA ligase subunit beta [Candidatus Omnitrophota bacterium]
MNIYEYQAMSLFSQYGIDTVPWELVDTLETISAKAKSLGGRVMLKAQVLAGSRGKSGGVKLVSCEKDLKSTAEEILSLTIKSLPVKSILLAQAVKIKEEYYLGLTLDRGLKKIVFMLSSSGGVEIEEIAQKTPQKIHKVYINPLKGPDESVLKNTLLKVFKTDSARDEAYGTLLKMYRIFIEKDCTLVEINPYAAVEPDNRLLALDAKINFDDNALFKHPEIESLRNPEEYSPDEIRARKANLSFVSMNGNVGCIVNGAGLAMATMDIIKLFGGEPANFLDVGGSSNPEKVLNALEIILANKKIKVILINIFGGITRCDDIAKGILMAKEKLNIQVPLVIRLVGTNEEKGQSMLREKGLAVAEKMSEAVKKAVEVL